MIARTNRPPSANVVLEAGLAWQKVAHEDGLYVFINLPEGLTDIRLTADGYATVTQQINIQEGEAKTLDLALSQGGAEGEGEGEGGGCAAGFATDGLPIFEFGDALLLLFLTALLTRKSKRRIRS